MRTVKSSRCSAKSFRVFVDPHLMLSVWEIYALPEVNLWEGASSVGGGRELRNCFVGRRRTFERFISINSMDAWYIQFIWVKQSFQGGRREAGLRLRLLKSIWLSLFRFAAGAAGLGDASFSAFFVCLFCFLLIDWLLPWTWVLWWRMLGQKKKHKWQLLAVASRVTRARS